MLAAFFQGMSALLSDRAIPAPLIPLPSFAIAVRTEHRQRAVTAAAHTPRHRRF
jgi:hypothetical protein